MKCVKLGFLHPFLDAGRGAMSTCLFSQNQVEGVLTDPFSEHHPAASLPLSAVWPHFCGTGTTVNTHLRL